MSGATPENIGLELINTLGEVVYEGRKHFLEIKARNNTSVDLSQYRIEVEFPKSFLNLNTHHNAEVEQRSTTTHMFLRHTQADHAYRVICPGDSQVQILVEYYVNEQNYRSAGQLPIKITFSSSPYRQDKVTSMAELIPALQS